MLMTEEKNEKRQIKLNWCTEEKALRHEYLIKAPRILKLIETSGKEKLVDNFLFSSSVGL